MNEKKTALIETIPAVNELRKVKGFNPLRFLHKAVSKTGEPVLKLDLPYKKLWFRLACPNGRMLLTPLRITEQMAIFEAKIYFSKDDPTPAASFTSTQMARDVPGGMYLRAAQDEALNEALDNAGFGIQLCDVAQVSDGGGRGSEIPLSQVEAAGTAAPIVKPAAEQLVESPTQTGKPAQHPEPEAAAVEQPAAQPQEASIPAAVVAETVEAKASAPQPKAEETVVSAPQSNPVPQTQAEDQTQLEEAAAPESAAIPMEVVEAKAAETPEASVTPISYTEDMSVEDICQRMDIDAAREIVVPKGTCKGMTLGQVANRRPASLNWYLLESSKMSNIVKAGAKLLLNEITLKKAG